MLSVISTLSFAEALREPAALVSKLVYLPLWAVGVGAVILLWRPATTHYIRPAAPSLASPPAPRRAASIRSPGLAAPPVRCR